MRLTRLLFLCLYATVNIHLITSYPSNGPLYTDDGIYVQIYQPPYWINYGARTISITQHQNRISIDFEKKHQETWNPSISIWDIKSIKLSPPHNYTLRWTDSNKTYDLQFGNSQKSNAFYQAIQNAKEGNHIPPPTVTQSSQRNLPGVNVESTSGNQRDNGMERAPDQTQQANNNERSKSYFSQGKGNMLITNAFDGWDSVGEATIRIKQQNTNKFQMVAIKEQDKSTVFNIQNIKEIELWPPRNNNLQWKYDGRVYSLTFSNADGAQQFHQAIKAAQNMQDAQSPATAQQSNTQQVNKDTNSLAEVHSATNYNEGESEALDQIHQSPINSISHPGYIISVHGTVSTISEHQDTWDKHGPSMIRMQQNKQQKLLSMMVNNTDQYLSINGITNFTRPEKTFFQWEYENVQYELELAAETDANNFAQAMNDALSVSEQNIHSKKKHHSIFISSSLSVIGNCFNLFMLAVIFSAQ